MELSTTRSPVNAVTTQTPVGPPVDTSTQNMLAQLLRNRMAAGQAQSAPSMAAAPPRAAARPEIRYRPQMASGTGSGEGEKPPEKEITRVVTDPEANPYQRMATGQPPAARVERYIKGLGWEFDDLRPHGNSGGISGGGALSTLHANDDGSDPFLANNFKGYKPGMTEAQARAASAPPPAPKDPQDAERARLNAMFDAAIASTRPIGSR